MDLLVVDGIDISHFRLVELTRLADQARPFYDWVESQFQLALSRSSTLDDLLRNATGPEIRLAIERCYNATRTADLPVLFDGVGRTYVHSKACYYFFAWLIRDAPQQRLGPLIQKIVRNSGKTRTEVEISVLASLIHTYRSNVKTFSWEAVREVIIDRLEGSRRSIKGHEKESVARTALLMAFQEYFAENSDYGIYAGIEIPGGQVMIGNESYDVSANLLDFQGRRIRRILMPIKTRETEGGGHSHLFSRDILSAINTAKYDNPDDYVVVVIVAKNWSRREFETIRNLVDHIAILDLAPSEFSSFSDVEQARLNNFVAGVLKGSLVPKTLLNE